MSNLENSEDPKNGTNCLCDRADSLIIWPLSTFGDKATAALSSVLVDI
ncbi:hypothetical protein PESHB5_15360 [Pediococcus parvulus]